MKKQIIYCGPPGTGKTFNIKQQALEILCTDLSSKLRQLKHDEKCDNIDKNLYINKFKKFYENNPKLLTEDEYKPGKKLYRNLTSINKLMYYFIDLQSDKLSKSEIIKRQQELKEQGILKKNENPWRGPSSFIQHERMLTDFYIADKENSGDKTILKLNEQGKVIKNKYIEYLNQKNEDKEVLLHASNIPSCVQNKFIETLKLVEDNEITLWINTIFSMFYLGLVKGFIPTYSKVKTDGNVDKDPKINLLTLEEREIIKKCCGYTAESLDFFNWTTKYLIDLGLVDEIESDDKLIYKKFCLNNKAQQIIQELKILQGLEVNNDTKNLLYNDSKFKYVLKKEYREKNKLISYLFREYKDKYKNIDIITFHPSFEYENFIEGISVKTDGEGSLKYYNKDGIFKKVCYKGLKNLIINNFNENDGLGTNYSDIETINTKLKDWKTTYNEYLKHRDILDWNKCDKYVIIIDEINRGDMAKIFGETITLIENDKRLGSENEITVTLPFTNDEFGIPKNVYILATMNTSDRSIGAIDIALRRRFSFVQFNPNFDLLNDIYEYKGDNIEDNLLYKSTIALKKINSKLAKVPFVGLDKLIGHSVLMLGNTITDEQIYEAWKNDIFPMIEEYFFGEYEHMIDILNCDDEEFISEFSGFNKQDDKMIKNFINKLVKEND